MTDCQARPDRDGTACKRCGIRWDRDDTAPPCPREVPLVPPLVTLLHAATVSASGLDITIACDDHDTKDAILNALTGVGYVSALAPDRFGGGR